MNKLFLFLLIVLALLGCNQKEATTLEEVQISNIIIEGEREEIDFILIEPVVEVIEKTEAPEVENEVITVEVPKSAFVERPIVKNLPEDAKFEALVLHKSGATLYDEPVSNSKKVGSLNFGRHVFAILEIDDWMFVHSNGMDGWIKKSTIQEIPYDSSKKIEVNNPSDILVLVNKTYRLPRNYKPDNLVIPNVKFPFEGTAERKHLRVEAARGLEAMFTAALAEGIELFGLSGYRSFNRQEEIFPNFVLQGGFNWANQRSAFPGESEHQTGLAMDVTSQSVDFRLVEQFGDKVEGIWVRENAHTFGFIVRYPRGKEEITGYTYEPWHLRYVGPKAATEIFESNITLEEYLGKRH